MNMKVLLSSCLNIQVLKARCLEKITILQKPVEPDLAVFSHATYEFPCRRGPVTDIQIMLATH